MVNLITLKSTRHTSHKLLFSKTELTKILNSYSNGVIKDHWRDYAIDQNGKFQCFPYLKTAGKKLLFVLQRDERTIKSQSVFLLNTASERSEVSSNLDKILKRLENMPKLLKN